MSDVLQIRERPPHLSDVVLLEAEGLLTSDLTEPHLDHFFFTGTDGAPSALVGLEIYGEAALLRSLVVSAAAQQVRALYLLTTTAETYFEHRGYERIDRAEAPPAIKSTREFASLCPSRSAFMNKRL
jgi:amino-acid N-acetyltransferase